MILSDRLLFAVEFLKNKLIIDAPYDTGNLALNAIRIQQVDGNYHIVIGGEVAPYAIFTNEAWSKGNNPNEGWIQRAIDKAIPKIKGIMNGNLTEEEYLKDIATQEKIIKKKLEKQLETKNKQREKLGRSQL